METRYRVKIEVVPFSVDGDGIEEDLATASLIFVAAYEDLIEKDFLIKNFQSVNDSLYAFDKSNKDFIIAK